LLVYVQSSDNQQYHPDTHLHTIIQSLPYNFRLSPAVNIFCYIVKQINKTIFAKELYKSVQ
jgi:hypothetical protein